MNIGSTGYDHLCSPEGRIYQVEYASTAVLRKGTAIGMIGSDGIVLARVILKDYKNRFLYETNDYTQICTIDEHIGAAVTGSLIDAVVLRNRAIYRASEYRNIHGSLAPLNHIKQSVAQELNAYVLNHATKPYEASLILGAYEPAGPQLYCIHPSGAVAGYLGCAIGRNADAARSEMENIDFKNTPIVQLVKDAARIMYAVHYDERISENFDVELSWCGGITNGRHVLVPSRVFKEAVDYAENMMKIEESYHF